MNQNVKEIIPGQTMSVFDLAAWGVQDVAYVKRVTLENDTVGWGIFGAQGNNIGVAPSREVAFAAVRQHDLEPLSVH